MAQHSHSQHAFGAKEYFQIWCGKDHLAALHLWFQSSAAAGDHFLPFPSETGQPRHHLPALVFLP